MMKSLTRCMNTTVVSISICVALALAPKAACAGGALNDPAVMMMTVRLSSDEPVTLEQGPNLAPAPTSSPVASYQARRAFNECLRTHAMSLAEHTDDRAENIASASFEACASPDQPISEARYRYVGELIFRLVTMDRNRMKFHAP